MSEKMIQDEKFCAGCRYFDEENRSCVDRPDAVNVVTGKIAALDCYDERKGIDPHHPMGVDYKPCGHGVIHWKEFKKEIAVDDPQNP